MTDNRRSEPWPFGTKRVAGAVLLEQPAWASVPVCLGFDATKPIGSVRLLAAHLPPTPDWCLALAYTAPVLRCDAPTIGTYQIVSFSPQSDAGYLSYLLRNQTPLPDVEILPEADVAVLTADMLRSSELGGAPRHLIRATERAVLRRLAERRQLA